MEEQATVQEEAVKKKKMISGGLIAAIFTLVVFFVIGVIFYMNIEGWPFVDAFYFVGVTLTTIGYGDIYPKTDIGRIFTVIFAFVGVGTTLLVLSIAAEHYFTRRVEQIIKTQPDKRIAQLTKDVTKKLVHELIPEPLKPKSMQKDKK